MTANCFHNSEVIGVDAYLLEAEVDVIPTLAPAFDEAPEMGAA